MSSDSVEKRADHKSPALRLEGDQRPERPPIDPSLLDALRRGSGLKIDEAGVWWHQGEKFTHQRLLARLNEGLFWRASEPAVRLGSQWCYIDATETPFLVLKMVEAHALQCVLNSGEVRPLGDGTLELNAAGVLFVRWPSWGLARFSRRAQAQCAPWLSETGARFCLNHHLGTWTISQRGASPQSTDRSGEIK